MAKVGIVAFLIDTTIPNLELTMFYVNVEKAHFAEREDKNRKERRSRATVISPLAKTNTTIQYHT